MTPWLPIETARLLLREFVSNDEPDIHEYASDPEVCRFAIWGPNDTEATGANLVRRLSQQKIWPRDSVEVALELRAEGRVIGTMRLSIQDRANRTADFGFVLNRSYWRKGYTTEGARALLQAAFGELGLHRVWATCDVRNHASYRVMEKLGMKREGCFPKDMLVKGEWRDSYLYAILAKEWQQAKGPRISRNG